MAVVAVAAVTVVGAALYSLTRTVQVPGQKLGEIAQQTAKEGEPRQIIYGIVRPIGGNLVAVQEPPRIERRKQKSGGKGGGGGGSSTTIEVPRRTYAIGICEGPVTGIRRAWRNNKLVYDGRGTAWGARNNGTFLQRFRFYLGGWDQMPDPSLEAVFGVGTVPAMRGTCYMVARDEDLQDTGGAVPQWIFEVERAYGEVLTTALYPYETADAAVVGAGFVGGRLSGQEASADDATAVVPGYVGHLLAGNLLDAEDAAGVVPGYVGHVLAGKLLYDEDAATVTTGYVGHVVAGVGTEQSNTADVVPGYVGATIE